MMTNKEHLNVGTIGHVDHGKTTLTAALTIVQAARLGGDARSYAEVARASAAQGRRDETKIVTITAGHVEYASDRRHYAHIDCPGHADYVKNMITGAAQMDAAIVVVDASRGPERQTREHVLLARQVGIEHLVLFLNKVDVADPELVDVVELEANEILEAHGFFDARVIRGSAKLAIEDIGLGKTGASSTWVAGIVALVDALDKVPTPMRDVTAPFLMPVENVHTIAGRGTVATGRISRGTVRAADSVELVGLVDEAQGARRVVVTGVQAFRRNIEVGGAGDNVGVLLRGVKRGEIERGQLLAAPNSIRPHAAGSAELYSLAAEEGGRKTPFGIGYAPQFFFGTTHVTGRICAINNADVVSPGDRAVVQFELLRPVGVEPGMRFAVREGGRTIGAGIVTEVQ